MQKVIIHNYTPDTSYAFTLAELGYRLYENSWEARKGDNARYEWDGRTIGIRNNDKSITVTVKLKGEAEQ